MLDKYRKEIDAIDKKLLELFEKRLDIASKIGVYKKENGLEILCEKRESEILSLRVSETKNPLYKEHVKEFFQNLMYISRKIQEK